MSVNAVRTGFKNVCNTAALQIAKVYGEKVTFTQRGIAASVYCLPEFDGATGMRVWGSTRSREFKRTFEIPSGQTGFPPTEGPMADATITDENGDIFVVRDFTRDDLGAMFTFSDCVNTKVKTIGVV